MAEKIKCTNCGKELDKRGLRIHNLMSHPGTPQNVVTNETQESANEVDCPHCRKKEQAIEELNRENEKIQSSFLERISDRDLEIEDLRNQKARKQNEIDQRVSEIEALHNQLTAAQQNAGVIPDLGEVIAHCENGHCSEHAKQWVDIKAKIVQSTLDNLPDAVVESEGLKRGLIPTRIIIPASAFKTT